MAGCFEISDDSRDFFNTKSIKVKSLGEVGIEP
jgi:hypothetical protein